MAKCSECGYLAIWNTLSRQLEETDHWIRTIGAPPPECHPPSCFKLSNNLWAESGLSTPSICLNDPEKICTTMQKERDCIQFVKWQPGYAPKEHQEMIDRERRDIFEQDVRRNDRKWHWIELIAIIIGTGLFTLLGAWIANMR
jgi:hypothetical protein